MIGRRQFLGAAAAGAAFAATGCSPCPGDANVPARAAARPHPAAVPAAAAARALVAEGAVAAAGEKGPFTVAGLLAAPSFFIAHRGSGDNWPEHTLHAYRQSAAAGLKALEVAVSSTRDGVLVCHHDLNTARLTGTDLTIARASYAALAALRNDARAWLGPATPLEPIPLLTEVLDAFAGSHVIFLEDKPGTNADEILALLEGYPGAREHLVWKQPASSPGHVQAAANGYATWGYFSAPDRGRIAELVPKLDLLGIHHTAPEAMVRELVASGKPVIAWEVHRRSEHLRLRELGVRGFICSNVRHVLHQEEPRSQDGFAGGRRGTGDLPWRADAVWDEQPAFVDGAVRIASQEKSGYLLGSMAGAADAPDWELEFELRWPEGLPSGQPGAGVAFGQDGDTPYRADAGPTSAGYHLDVGGDGRLTLYRQDGREGSAVRLAEAGSPAPASGQWLKFVVSVHPWSIGVRRLGAEAAVWTLTSEDTRYGGGWFSLLKNYDAGPPVEFRGVRARSLAATAAATGSCANVG
ncbi:glycerophosphodiester phosphodiesterase [Pseudarthrobacter sp. H2]|uniref:glycerophosphodiester phosphodiesterase n=1 Tax=Pseudarthrobacter sp. H2 TaxID=3418415 RepID=UPI003CF88427